jgi:hypothetical protein
METDKKKPKRASKGKRKHIRMIKQESRKAGLSEAEIKKKTQQA